MEFNKESGFCWITEGKEIENYISPELINEAIKNTHPKAETKGITKYSNPVELKSSTNKRKFANKIKVAQYIVNNHSDLDMNYYDLSEKIAELIFFIESANPGIYIPGQAI